MTDHTPAAMESWLRKLRRLFLTFVVCGSGPVTGLITYAQLVPVLGTDCEVPIHPPLGSFTEREAFPNAATAMFIGRRSCASSGCHGDLRRETVVGAAANYFLDHDRHQLAGTVLRNPRSLDIATRLNLPTVPWETRECLVCHAPAAMDAPDRTMVSAMLSEGVSCESCHGAAREWLVPHRAVEWNRSEFWSSSRKAELGFVDTKQLSLRIDRCADCHVGNATQSVNHNLIAAGHPRLAFEFSAYQSRMPIHWRQANERQRSPVANRSPSSNRSTWEARNWLIGQIVNADHELQILSAATTSPKTTWPELAQYDCFACHHELSFPGWRQARNAWNLRLGELPWGTWNLGLIAESQPAISAMLSSQFVTDQESLRQQMKSLSADRSDVLSLVSKLRQELSRAKNLVTHATFTPEDLIAIRDRIFATNETISNQGWDRSTQLFLAAVALDKGANDAIGFGNRVTDPRQAQYERLRELLSFKETSQTVPPFNDRESPSRFESNRMSIRKEFEQLRSSDAKTNQSEGSDQPTDNLPPSPKTPASETD